MTKKELKKEAEEWIIKNSKEFITNPNYSPFDYAEGIYLASALPREKRIAELTEQNISLLTSVENLNKSVQELEAEVKEWKDKADLWCKTANLKDHNIMINKELEKENAELKTRVSEQSERISELTQELDDKINRFG